MFLFAVGVLCSLFVTVERVLYPNERNQDNAAEFVSISVYTSIHLISISYIGHTTPTSSGNQNVLFRTEYLDSIDANGKGEGKCT